MDPLIHYDAVDAGKINVAITQALEARRIAAANAIASARSEDELDEAMERLMGGFASSVSGNGFREPTGYAFANGKSLRSSPGAFSVFSHGICPGGDCAQGGEKRGSSHLPVHRDKACSRCRFRFTLKSLAPPKRRNIQLDTCPASQDPTQTSYHRQKLL